MEPQLDVDDPGRVDEFLNFMSSRAAKQDVTPSQDEQKLICSSGEQESVTAATPPSDNAPHDILSTSATATPAEGFRAPPPTPASIAAAIEKGAGHLETVPEDAMLDEAVTDEKVAAASVDSDKLAEGHVSVEAKAYSATEGSSNNEPIISPKTATIRVFDAFSDKNGNQSLSQSKFAGPRSSSSLRARPVLSPRIQNTERSVPQKTEAAATKPNHTSTMSEAFQDHIVEKFRKATEPTVQALFVKKAEGGHDSSVAANIAKENQSLPRSPDPVLVAKVSVSPSRTFRFKAENIQEFKPDSKQDRHVTFDISAAKLALSEDEASSESTTIKSDATDDAPIKTNVKVTEDVPARIEDGQDRDNATFFTSWGAPEARSTPKAEIRRVILIGLPSAADNSLVAGLVHGGPLESFRIVKSSEGAAFVSAIITFTTGAAAKRYNDKYPNGLPVKVSGKKYVITVNMGENVDVVSGVMRGYLESGATRVVRASGADEDWGIKALRKLAEGKGRKLEAIIDTFKDETRAIEFRFTNIADAVAFRGTLIRDIEWEDCSISFGEDPCGKAVEPRKE